MNLKDSHGTATSAQVKAQMVIVQLIAGSATALDRDNSQPKAKPSRSKGVFEVMFPKGTRVKLKS